MNEPRTLPLSEPKGYRMWDGSLATRMDFIRFKLGTGPEPQPISKPPLWDNPHYLDECECPCEHEADCFDCLIGNNGVQSPAARYQAEHGIDHAGQPNPE